MKNSMKLRGGGGGGLLDTGGKTRVGVERRREEQCKELKEEWKE